MLSPWRIVALSFAALGLATTAISFVHGDLMCIACGPSGSRRIECRPSILWLSGATLAFSIAVALWLATRRARAR